MSLKNNAVTLDVQVQTRSSKSIIQKKGEVIKVYLKAPPVDGKANKECISLFSKVLHIPKSSIEIKKGEHGKRKVIQISGLSLEAIIQKISEGEK